MFFSDILNDLQVPFEDVLSLRDVFNLVYGFGQLHLIPHTELLTRLEPYILEKSSQFQADQLNQIAQFYIRMQRGSEFFLRKLMAEVSLRQDDARINSQVALVEVLDAKTLRRSDAELDFTLEMRAIAKAIVKKINHLRIAKGDLQVIIPRFLYYQIGMKPYYEMLAIEFTKHADSFSFKDKCKLLEYFALVDIDSGSILKTAQKMCQVYVEAFMIRGTSTQDIEVPRLGMYSESQIRYIEDATRDINELRRSIVKIDVEEAKREGAEELLQRYKDQLEHAETSNLIKLVWSYMVFSSGAEKGYKHEQSILWGRLRDLINQKLASFPKNSDKFKLRTFDGDQLHQINAFLMLDLGLKEKEGLRIPGDIRFEALSLTKSSPHREAEYKGFIKKTTSFLHQNNLLNGEFQDFYRLTGGKNLSNQATAEYIYLNHKQWYFEDTKERNSFVRIRDDHLKKMGITRAIQLDFYDVRKSSSNQLLQYLNICQIQDFDLGISRQIIFELNNLYKQFYSASLCLNFKKGYTQIKEVREKEQEDEEELFSMEVKGEGLDDPAVAYVKRKLGM